MPTQPDPKNKMNAPNASCIGSFFKPNTRLLSLVLLGSILLYLGYISLKQSLTNQFASIGIKYIEKSNLYATKQNKNSKSITFKNWSIVYEQHVRKSGLLLCELE